MARKKKKAATIRIAKEDVRVRPRLGIQHTKVHKPESVYQRRAKHPKAPKPDEEA